MAHKFGSRGGHVVRVTAGGNAVYGAPADRKPSQAHVRLKKAATGLLEVVGGIAAAGALGAVAGKVARVASGVENTAKTVGKLQKVARAGRQAKLAKFALKSQIVQRGLDLAHDTLRFGAAATGTYAIDKGANDVLAAADKKSTATEIVALGGATKAALVVTRAAEGLHLSPTAAVALRNALKKMSKPIKRPF